MKFLKTYFNKRTAKIAGTLVLGLLLFNSCEDDVISSGDLRDEYVGQWVCNEDSEQYGVSTYSINISKGIDEDHIEISNFYNLGNTESVSVFIEDNNLTISSQDVKGNTISGSGTSNVSFNTINFTYTVFDGAETDHVTAQYTR
jgi:hypothetical protein